MENPFYVESAAKLHFPKESMFQIMPLIFPSFNPFGMLLHVYTQCKYNGKLFYRASNSIDGSLKL